MTIGYDAPVPPAASGVADYAAALRAALRERVEISPRAPLWLAHIGNNREHHEAIYRRALARPTVAILHDAVLIHLHLAMAGGEQTFVDEFTYNYGRWHADLARELWRGRALSGGDAEYFRWPLLKRLCERARAVVVHNAGAARRVREHAPAAQVVVIPHLAFETAAPAARVAGLRKQWGCLPSTFAFGILGHLRESKRVLPVLRSFARLEGDVKLILAGAFQHEALERAVLPLLGDRVVRSASLSEPDLRAVVQALDAGLSLRWPSAGETSGIAIRFMAAAKPVFVTRAEETTDLPEGACLKVDPGLAEEDHLLALMRWLTLYPGAGRRIGALGAEHIAREHAPRRVAGLYLEALRS